MAADPDNIKPRLAIIGTGIAGLTSAYLASAKFDVTIYESQPRAGMGAHVVDYVSNGIESRIDIPLRIFSPGYYESLMALYDHIGVEVITSDHAGAFADETGEMLLHYGNAGSDAFQFSYLKTDSLFSGRAWRLALQSRRFFKQAESDARNLEAWSQRTFGQYLQQAAANRTFVDQILLPILSATCTCDYDSVLSYPADIMLGYLTCGVHKLGITSAAKGVDDIVPRLLKDEELRTGTPVTSISMDGTKMRVADAKGNTDRFDHVIMATQAHQAAAVLTGFEPQKELLEQIPFERSEVSVHTDDDLMPETRTNLSPVTYHVPEGGRRAEVSVDLSKAIDRLRGQESVFQTWNPIRNIAANRELARVTFTRPTVTFSSRKAVRELKSLQDSQGNRLWFCGSYMTEKIPLLEAAVDSATSVATALQLPIPWQPASNQR